MFVDENKFFDMQLDYKLLKTKVIRLEKEVERLHTIIDKTFHDNAFLLQRELEQVPAEIKEMFKKDELQFSTPEEISALFKVYKEAV